MAASTLVQAVTINGEVTYIRIKFLKTLLFGSISNNAFSLATDVATPVVVSDPFETVDPTDSEQYNSIARELWLYIKPNKLAASTSYVLSITGLQDANGTVIADDTTIEFTTPDNYDTTYDDSLPVEVSAVQVQDQSIKRNIYTSVTELTQANVDFYIESTNPETDEWFLTPDHNNGRFVIKFSKAPSASFLNTGFISIQRKAIQRNPSRWETLDAVISMDTDEPWVYIDFPSYDHYPEAATPSTTVVYTTGSHGYFEEGYRYRIIMSKSIGA
jgi:hypothetical protein